MEKILMAVDVESGRGPGLLLFEFGGAEARMTSQAGWESVAEEVREGGADLFVAVLSGKRKAALEALESIRTHPRTADIPVLTFFTGGPLRMNGAARGDEPKDFFALYESAMRLAQVWYSTPIAADALGV